MKKNAIDLHIHTTASDGTFSPEDIVNHSLASGLKAIAITDHDTIDGVKEALKAGQKLGIEVIPGVELSVNFPKGEMHILGYFIDYESPLINSKLGLLQKYRNERNPKIMEKLQAEGLEVSLEEAQALAGGKILGRPHIASLLMEKGYVNSIQEAFEVYLAKGKPGYVPKERLTPKEGISLIKEGGGIAVLAHPKHLGLADHELEEVLKDLKDDGLDGLEVYYTTQTPEETNKFLSLCSKYDLLATGGTDFHGSNKPQIRLGVGQGALHVPYYLVERMKEKIPVKG